ncbi:MAG: extracellular solute-binding protein [Anaerolineales bacterium]
MSMHLNRRQLLRSMAVGTAGVVLAACQPKVVEKVVKETVIVEGTPKVIEKTVVVEKEGPPPTAAKYEKVIVWGWWEPRMAFYQDAANALMDQNPDIEVEVISLPGDQLWSKVLPATAAGTGPTLLKQKPTYYFSFLDNGLLEPYPEEIFPIDWWKTNFPDTWDIYGKEGRQYVYLDGSMANLLMYNRTMFEAVGLDPQTPPVSWDELINMGKQLTKTDSAGTILEEGLILGEYPWINAVYQLGGSLVNIADDGTRTSAMLSEPAVKAFTWLCELYTKHKISSREFLTYEEAIGTSKAAMGLMTSWIVGTFDTTYPDVAAVLGWAPPPTPTGKPEPVWGYKTNVLALTMFQNRPVMEKEAGFVYLDWLLNNSDKSLADIAEITGCLPGKLSVRSDPRFTAKEALRVAIDTLPLEKSSVMESENLNAVRDNAINRVVLEGQSIEESLAIADQEWNQWLAEGDASHMA